MSRDRRDDVLKALREIYDGYWRRQVGTDGGRSFEWEGRIVLSSARSRRPMTAPAKSSQSSVTVSCCCG